MNDNSPIFVVGRDRAAARRMTELITAHDRLGAVPVSALLGDLAAATERNQDGLAYYGYPEQYWFTSLAGLVDTLQHDHVAQHGKARWVDCPPWGRPSVELIDRLFPHAQVVHVTGGPRFRSTGSRRRAGAERLLGNNRYLEVTIPDLNRDPSGCADRVWRFLGEARPASVPSPAEPEEAPRRRRPHPSLAA